MLGKRKLVVYLRAFLLAFYENEKNISEALLLRALNQPNYQQKMTLYVQ